MEFVNELGKVFERKDYSVQKFPKGEYENCRFLHCEFSNVDLSGVKFIDCYFEHCNLTLVQVKNTHFGDVSFKHCKMLGMHFFNCNEYGLRISLENCLLHHASFYQRVLKKMIFRHCSLQEVDFTAADLSGAVFDHCDLSGAVFDHTLLEKADFSSASNYVIDPANNAIKKAVFSLHGIPGLLEKYDIEIKA